MEISVIHVTAKGAKLVTDHQKVTWVSPKQINENNQLTEDGLNSLMNSPLTYEAYLQKEKENNQKFYDELKSKRETPFNVKELEATATEKAIGIVAYVLISDESKTKLLWIPKSTIDQEGCVPYWMIDSNLNKLEKELENPSDWKKVIE